MNRGLAIVIILGLIIFSGLFQGWIFALTIVQFALISAIMAMGVNMQWGYAGIFNVGVVGFVALGGLAAVLVSHPPVPQTIEAGGSMMLGALLRLAFCVVLGVIIARFTPSKKVRNWLLAILFAVGFFWVGSIFSEATAIIENTDAAKTGFLGGLGWPVWISWIVGALFAAGAAWGIGKLTLGLRADYLAIATLGIAEIVVSIVRNENWMTRGVKNVTGMPRPVPYELDLQEANWFLEMCARYGFNPATASSIFVKLCYIGIFLVILGLLLWFAERALHAPWGRMVRAIRDNRDAASAMGKNVNKRHLQIFVLGSAVVGLAGAMMVTLDGQLTPNSYNPLRFTFLIWVMVIVGGSGNNWGAIVGAFFIWFFWIEAERLAPWVMEGVTYYMPDGDLKSHLIGVAPQLRLMVMGVILILALRFAPQGLLPEQKR